MGRSFKTAKSIRCPEKNSSEPDRTGKLKLFDTLQSGINSQVFFICLGKEEKIVKKNPLE